MNGPWPKDCVARYKAGAIPILGLATARSAFILLTYLRTAQGQH